MTPAVEHQTHWERYLAAEQHGDRRAAMLALTDLVDALRAAPRDERRAWIVDFCRRVLDGGESAPIRHPLFAGLLVPFLKEELTRHEYPAARWLASLSQQLYAHQAIWKELAFITERRLLEQALVHDPGDHRAKQRLFRVLWDELRYATHALPHGVLDGVNGASIEGCACLLTDVDSLGALGEALEEPPDRMLQIDRWRKQIEAYRDHLTSRPELSFRALLEKRGLL